ncbi:MAG TPA: methyltransferase domain-containing protein [Microthrixaceae bacterium]|nr:methyltransferase domain-containing protein [Microthrixaceae bacterium]
MASFDHPVHEFLCDRLRVRSGQVLVDLGCGAGATLVAAARRFLGVHLVGYDERAADLELARRHLGPGPVLEVVDLDGLLPLDDASVDAVVSHNLIECLADPVRLMNETARVLLPGGSAVWSHTDFDTVVTNTADVELSRRILHSYADAAQPWMRHADPRMGRKLAGLVRHSHLQLVAAEAHTVVCLRNDRAERRRAVCRCRPVRAQRAHRTAVRRRAGAAERD